MSSRVQKGGPVFRPVVKSRSRPTPSQPSQISSSQPQLDPQTSAHHASSMPPPAIHIPDLDTSSIPKIPDISGDSQHLVDIPGERRGLSLPPAIRSSVPPSLVAHPSPILNTTSTESNALLEASIPSKVHPNSTSSSEVKVNIQPRRAIGRRKSSGTTKTLVAHNEDQNSIERPKRKRTTPKVMDTDQVEGDGRPVTSVSIRGSRPPSLPPYDADANPGEDIDPTVVTMAALCTDSGQGRVSSKAAEILNNHASWKAQNREKRARMRSLMEAKKYGRDEDGDHQDTPTSNSIPALPESSDPPEPIIERAPSNALIVDDTGHGFDYSQNMATSRYNVQVRIGPNGETIIDEESLVVDRADADETENYTHVIESDHTKFVNSGTYGKRYRGSRWSAEETELFYDALAQYGENYELIAYILPGRDRKSCKNKFKIEDKRNPARINHCLNNSIPVDMQMLARMTGKDFSGPIPDILAPTPTPIPPPSVVEDAEAKVPSSFVKKRQHSKKRTSSDAVIVGNVENFEEI